MVSSLISSFTDLLSGPAPEEGQQRRMRKLQRRRSRERKQEINDNVSHYPSSSARNLPTNGPGGRRSTTKLKSSPEFVNAESLDRAIVCRLQSKVSFITPTPGEENYHKESRSTSREERRRREESPERQERIIREESPTEEISLAPTPSGDKAEIQHSKPDDHHDDAITVNNVWGTIPAETLQPSVQVPEISELATKPASNTEFAVLKETAAVASSYKSFTEQDSTTPLPNSSTSGENRSIVYKNAQFNLENASRETLVSEPPLPFMLNNENSLANETRRLTAMFAIPKPFDLNLGATAPENNLDKPEALLENITLASSRTRINSSARSPAYTATYSGSNANLAEHVFETTMNNIIENGGEEFKNKYSSWVWEAFRSHLVHLKSLLLNEFNEKMKNTLNERELEVMNLQQQYRDKLAEFDVTTEGFQKMIDNLYQENQKVLKAKDLMIEKLKKEFLECRRHFEHDLIRQMQNYRKEAEVEKLELQKRNDELMMVMLTDASKSGLEESFKREIESLHKMIKALTTQNEVLHQQLEEATSAASIINRKTVDAVQTQLEQANREIAELRKRLQNVERDKEDLTVSHNEQIAKLNRRMQESSTRYDHQLRDAAEEMENLRKRYQKEIKELKLRLQNQEMQHGQLLNQVKQQYGGQVESLSRAVSQLQTELTMNASKRFP